MVSVPTVTGSLTHYLERVCESFLGLVFCLRTYLYIFISVYGFYSVRKVHFPSVQLPSTLEPSAESPPNWKVLLDGSGRGGQVQCGL